MRNWFTVFDRGDHGTDSEGAVGFARAKIGEKTDRSLKRITESERQILRSPIGLLGAPSVSHNIHGWSHVTSHVMRLIAASVSREVAVT